MTRLRMKLQNQSKKPLKGKKREEVQLLQHLQNALEKCSTNENSRIRKKPQESRNKTKSNEEKNNCDPKAPKQATRSSSQKKSVPEKLKNYFTEQD